jgi:hypothetical protein
MSGSVERLSVETVHTDRSYFEDSARLLHFRPFKIMSYWLLIKRKFSKMYMFKIESMIVITK